MDIQTIINLLIFIFPAYIANAVPVLLGGGAYLDFGKKFFDKHRILGNGKTIRGFLAGVLGGIVAGGMISFFILLPFFLDTKTQFLTFVLLSIGTMIGDALGSFIKRRLVIKPGKPFIMDQLMFLLVALVFAYPFVLKTVYEVNALIFLFITTYILHVASNFFANKIGWKKVSW